MIGAAFAPYLPVKDGLWRPISGFGFADWLCRCLDTVADGGQLCPADGSPDGHCACFWRCGLADPDNRAFELRRQSGAELVELDTTGFGPWPTVPGGLPLATLCLERPFVEGALEAVTL